MVARTNCTDLSREDEFNDWYEKFHVPDVMGTPGFVSARRFVSPNYFDLELGRYLAIYEIETGDIGQTMAALNTNMVKSIKQGRWSDLLIPVSVAVYRQISSLTK